MEALNEGEARKEVALGDAVFQMDALFNAQAINLISTAMRYGGITWSEPDFGIFSELSRRTHRVK